MGRKGWTGRSERECVRKPVILITGAEGEIGHGLVTRLRDPRDGRRAVLGLSAAGRRLARPL